MDFYFGTVHYKAPELLTTSATIYSGSLDVWGLGVIFAELVCGVDRFFQGKSQTEVLENIHRFNADKLQYIKNLSQRDFTTNELDLLLRCLDLNPESRIHSSEALKHEYINKQ